MDIDRFWEIVDEVGWGHIDSDVGTDYKRGGKVLCSLINTKGESDSYDAHLRSVYDELYTAFVNWEKETGSDFGLGDDSFGDLIHHVIGLGKDETEATLLNPHRAWKRAMSSDFTESFSYCSHAVWDKFKHNIVL